MRLVHIYSSMLVLILFLFFAVTGITLNHPEWQSNLGASSSTRQLQLPETLRALPWNDDKIEQAIQAKQIAGWLREQHNVEGAVLNFSYDADTQHLELDFKRPAGFSTVAIAVSTGEVELYSEFGGTLQLLNDLHKGRYAGTSWKWLIDFTAVICVLFACTGFYLLWRQGSRRASGIYTVLLGGFCMWLAYFAALH